MAKKPYEQRTDLEKVQSQWHKLTGLHGREEWSAAVVRAATAAELAANYAIRNEFARQSKLSASFVNGLLKWANGLRGKMELLLLPIIKGRSRLEHAKELNKLAKEINSIRNGIVHQGQFCDDEDAKKAIEQARRFIEGLIRHYQPDFKLIDQKSSDRKK